MVNESRRPSRAAAKKRSSDVVDVEDPVSPEEVEVSCVFHVLSLCAMGLCGGWLILFVVLFFIYVLLSLDSIYIFL